MPTQDESHDNYITLNTVYFGLFHAVSIDLRLVSTYLLQSLYFKYMHANIDNSIFLTIILTQQKFVLDLKCPV
jgi:hypothetical protein